MKADMPNRIVLTNGKVITPYRVIPHGAVVIEGRAIAGVFSLAETDGAPAGAKVVDVGGRVIAPGFVDIHVHGGGGAELMEGNPSAPHAMAKAHARGGTTAIVPSTFTSSMADLGRVLDNVKAARQTDPEDGARILGIHLEGPYLSPEQVGAMNPRLLRRPEPKEYLSLLERYPEIIRMTAAPELPGGLALGRELQRRGILASIGHSNATFDEVTRAVEAGYTHITHLYSATSGVKRISAYRVAGVIESALLLDELTVEAIGDGRHLPASLLKLIYRAKGPERMALITDAMKAAGLPEGEYFVGSPEDGQRVIVEDDVAKLPDRSAFAGSVATMARVVRTAVQLAEIPLPDAVRMASATPARIIGADRIKGSLAEGKDADLVVFDEEDIGIKLTMVEGRIVFNELT